MDAGPSSRGRHIADEAPVVLTWGDPEIALDVFLQPTRPTTLFLSLDASKKVAAFRVRIPFQVDQEHGFLFAFIDPSHVHSLKAESHAITVPEPVRQSLVARGSSHGVVRLDLQLNQSPTIVGPASTTRLYPKSKGGGNLLACLRSMSRTRTLRVFVAEESLRMEKLSILCGEISDADLQPNVREYALEALYNSRGGKEISDLLTPFTLQSAQDAGSTANNPANISGPVTPAGERPPSYDQIQSPSPRLSETSVRREKRRASRENSATPAPKKSTLSSSPPSSQIAQLRAEIDQLRRQLSDSNVAEGSPTEDGSLLDRFEFIEQRLCALETRADSSLLERLESIEQKFCALEARVENNAAKSEQLQERLLEALVPRLLGAIRPHIDQRLDDCTHDWMAGLVEKEVKEQIDTVTDDLVEFKDDIELSVNDKLASAVQDDLAGVVAEQLGDIVPAKLEEVVSDVLENSNVSVQIFR